MKDTQGFPHDLMLEILMLREKKDMDAFMDKLYEAITMELKDVLDNIGPNSGKQEAISIMIRHFQNKEEYEKCAILQKLNQKVP